MLTQMSLNLLGQSTSHQFRNFLNRSSSYTCNASETQDETLLCLFSYALDSSQDRLNLSLTSEFTVECYSKTVRLISDLLQDLQGW